MMTTTNFASLWAVKQAVMETNHWKNLITHDLTNFVSYEDHNKLCQSLVSKVSCYGNKLCQSLVSKVSCHGNKPPEESDTP